MITKLSSSFVIGNMNTYKIETGNKLKLYFIQYIIVVKVSKLLGQQQIGEMLICIACSNEQFFV